MKSALSKDWSVPPTTRMQTNQDGLQYGSEHLPLLSVSQYNMAVTG